MGNLEMNECKKLIIAAYENVGGLELARAIFAPPEPDPPQGSNSNGDPHWCVCSKCRLMPHPAENVCCRTEHVSPLWRSLGKLYWTHTC